MFLSDTDELHLRRALHLAEEAAALASPNPTVGCVLALGEHVLGEGAHLYERFDHAEIAALKQAEALGHNVRGATAYVTLEPCTHHGRTAALFNCPRFSGYSSLRHRHRRPQSSRPWPGHRQTPHRRHPRNHPRPHLTPRPARPHPQRRLRLRHPARPPLRHFEISALLRRYACSSTEHAHRHHAALAHRPCRTCGRPAASPYLRRHHHRHRNHPRGQFLPHRPHRSSAPPPIAAHHPRQRSPPAACFHTS